MTDAAEQPEFLTTRELAALLRMRERRVYDLAAAGEIPCRRATGRLLFPRAEIERWLNGGAGAPAPAAAAPKAGIVSGSHDPLLEWALRASGCGLPSFFDGSLDGLDRLAAGEASVAGCHLRDGTGDGWNREAVSARLGDAPVVLIAFARRETGLLLGTEAAGRVRGLPDLAGLRVALRQARAGGRILFGRLLAEAGMSEADLAPAGAEPARTEAEAAAAVAAGRADAAPGLSAMAAEYRLGFLPLAVERYDLCIDRRFFFEPAWQRFEAFARGPAFAERARDLAGYDIAERGDVIWNGP